jgi:hypothetical protein
MSAPFMRPKRAGAGARLHQVGVCGGEGDVAEGVDGVGGVVALAHAQPAPRPRVHQRHRHAAIGAGGGANNRSKTSAAVSA